MESDNKGKKAAEKQGGVKNSISAKTYVELKGRTLDNVEHENSISENVSQREGKMKAAVLRHQEMGIPSEMQGAFSAINRDENSAE